MNTVNTRKKFFPNVTDEEWNDWTWQVKNRIEKIDDLSAIKLARDIATKIESTMQYPGVIKVNVIRETRAEEYAK